MPKFVIPTIFAAIDKISSPVAKMAASVRRFGDTADISLVRASRSFHKISTASDGIFNKIVNIKNALALAFAGGALKMVFDTVAGIAALGDEIDTTSKRLGVSAQYLQELEFAAKRQNISNETLIGSLEKLNKNVGDLKNGSGSLFSKLKTGNPTLLRQLKHVKNNEQAFNLLIHAIDKLPNQMQKASLAQAAFGKSGQGILNLIQDGPEGLKALREEARKFGGILSDEVIQAAAKFDDANDNMQASIFGLKVTLGSALMPIVTDYMVRLTEWITNNRELIKDKVAEFVDKITQAITWLSENFDTIVTWTKRFVIALASLKAITLLAETALIALKIASFGYNVAVGISAAVTGTMTKAVATSKVALAAYTVATWLATAAQWALNIAMNANPIGIIITAIAGLITLVVAIIKHWETWGETVASFMGPLGFVIHLIQAFRKNWDYITASFKRGGILEGIKAIGRTILEAILAPIQKVMEIIGKLPGMLGAPARAAAQTIQIYRDKMDTDQQQKMNQWQREDKFQEYNDRNVPFPKRIDPFPDKPAFNPKSASNDQIANDIKAAVSGNIKIQIEDKTGGKAAVTSSGALMPSIKTTPVTGTFAP